MLAMHFLSLIVTPEHEFDLSWKTKGPAQPKSTIKKRQIRLAGVKMMIFLEGPPEEDAKSPPPPAGSF